MSKIDASLEMIFQDHRVVFWYDDQGKMEDQFAEVSMNGLEKIVLLRRVFDEFSLRTHLTAKQYVPDRKKNSVSYFENSSWTDVLVSKNGKMGSV
jgi:hypothetical protein